MQVAIDYKHKFQPLLFRRLYANNETFVCWFGSWRS